MSNERHSFTAGASSSVSSFAWVESAKAELYSGVGRSRRDLKEKGEAIRGRRDRMNL